jgi:hypothetical protein
MKMKSDPETPSDAENAVTESCTRKEQRDVSFFHFVAALPLVVSLYIRHFNLF